MSLSSVGTCEQVLADAFLHGVMPGGVLSVWRAGRPMIASVQGVVGGPGSTPVNASTLYDLGSITKVITATAALRFVQRRRLALTDSIDSHIPELKYSYAGSRCIRDILTHSSGWSVRLSVVAHNSIASTLAELTRAVSNKASRGVHYSSINMFILGIVVSRVAHNTLDNVIYREVLEPLGMARTCFGTESHESNVAATDPKHLPGIVHDPTSRILGGITGHAGLFAPASDLQRFMGVWLNRGQVDSRQYLARRLVELSLRPLVRHDTGAFGLGWMIADTRYFGRAARSDVFGHPGFPGTLVLGMRRAAVSAILLTNWIFTTPNNTPAKLAFYRGVTEALDASIN